MKHYYVELMYELCVPYVPCCNYAEAFYLGVFRYLRVTRARKTGRQSRAVYRQLCLSLRIAYREFKTAIQYVFVKTLYKWVKGN